MNEIITIAVAIIVFAVIVKVANAALGDNKISKKRISALSETDENFVEVQQEFEREKSSFAIMLEGLVAPFRNVREEKEELEFKLYQAGATSPNAISYYLFFSTYGLPIGVCVMFLYYMFAKGFEGTMFWGIIGNGVIVSLMIAFGAKLWLENSIEKRKKVLIQSFPDALDLLLVCVESGLALDASLARVCKELKFAHPEITKELNKTRLELTMLNDREKALLNLGKRTDILAFKSLVAALLQSEKFGTSLVDTLRVLSDDYRQTRMMLAEERAGKLPAKIAMYTIPLMLMSLLILIASPAVIKAMSIVK